MRSVSETFGGPQRILPHRTGLRASWEAFQVVIHQQDFIEIESEATAFLNALSGQKSALISTVWLSALVDQQAMHRPARHFGHAGEQRLLAVVDTIAAQAGGVVIDRLTLPGRVGDVDVILILPQGIFLLESKYWSGRVFTSEGFLWRQSVPPRTVNIEPFRVDEQIRSQVDAVQQILQEKDVLQECVPLYLYPMVVLTHPNTRLVVDETPGGIPLVKLENVAKLVRDKVNQVKHSRGRTHQNCLLENIEFQLAIADLLLAASPEEEVRPLEKREIEEITNIALKRLVMAINELR